MADWQAGEESWGWKDWGCWAVRINVSIDNEEE